MLKTAGMKIGYSSPGFIPLFQQFSSHLSLSAEVVRELEQGRSTADLRAVLSIKHTDILWTGRAQHSKNLHYVVIINASNHLRKLLMRMYFCSFL